MGVITEMIICYHQEDSTFNHIVTKLGCTQQAVRNWPGAQQEFQARLLLEHGGDSTKESVLRLAT